MTIIPAMRAGLPNAFDGLAPANGLRSNPENSGPSGADQSRFSDYLESPIHKEPTSIQALSFDALGMFGRIEAVPYVQAALTFSTPTTPSDQTEAMSSAPAKDQSTALSAANIELEHVTALARLNSVQAANSPPLALDRPSPGPTMSTLLNGAGSASAVGADKSVEEPAPRGFVTAAQNLAQKLVHGSTQQQPPISLTVSGPNNALQVIARGVGDSPEARTVLKRRIDALAAEFGVCIADLTFDGSSVRPSHITRGS